MAFFAGMFVELVILIAVGVWRGPDWLRKLADLIEDMKG